MNFNIWLDDIRMPQDEFGGKGNVTIICRSVNDAIEFIERYEDRLDIGVISLDHDMGEYAKYGGDGIKLMDWMVERGSLYDVEFHTMNPVGRKQMDDMYKRYWLNMVL